MENDIIEKKITIELSMKEAAALGTFIDLALKQGGIQVLKPAHDIHQKVQEQLEKQKDPNSKK